MDTRPNRRNQMGFNENRPSRAVKGDNADGGIRTHNMLILNQPPLPIGSHRLWTDIVPKLRTKAWVFALSTGLLPPRDPLGW